MGEQDFTAARSLFKQHGMKGSHLMGVGMKYTLQVTLLTQQLQMKSLNLPSISGTHTTPLPLSPPPRPPDPSLVHEMESP